MPTLRFPLPAVLTAVSHAIDADRGTHKLTYDQQLDGAEPAPALWWAKDDGTYLMTNAPWEGGGSCPAIAYAEGYGPGTDARDMLGGDDFVHAFPLLEPWTPGGPTLFELLRHGARHKHAAAILRVRHDGDDMALTLTTGN